VTLIEFVQPLRDKPRRDLCLAVMYFEERYNQRSPLTVEDIRAGLIKARLPNASKINVADILLKAESYVDSAGRENNKTLWKLTYAGLSHVRQLLSLSEVDPEIEHDTSTLSSLAAKISNHEVKEYVLESIKCLSISAFRASVVFLWAGAIRQIQTHLLSKDSGELNSALKKFDKTAKNVSKVDDFAYIRESVLLQAAQELGIYDKHETKILTLSLDLRNSCGHPNKYNPGPKAVSSYIENVIGIVFV
jgi:hypothetical protein